MSKALNAPERIWLVYGDNDWDTDHNDLNPEDVCWSPIKEFPKDVGYVREDEVERLTRERDEAIAHKDQVIQDAIEMLGRTGHHRKMSFAEFVEAGGGECPICLKRERDEARAQAEGLAKALADAIECVELWGAYADVYFREKHNLAGDLVRLRAALPKEDDDGR